MDKYKDKLKNSKKLNFYYKIMLYKSNMWLNHKFCAMVAYHFNFQFQVLTLLKRTKELGLAHFIMDIPHTLWLMWTLRSIWPFEKSCFLVVSPKLPIGIPNPIPYRPIWGHVVVKSMEREKFIKVRISKYLMMRS